MFVIYFVNILLTGVITYMGTVRHRGGSERGEGEGGYRYFRGRREGRVFSPKRPKRVV